MIDKNMNSKANSENYEISQEVRLSMEKLLKESPRNKTCPLNIGIILTYLIPGNQSYIQLFWKEFIKKNKNNCYLIFYDKSSNLSKESDLVESFSVKKVPFVKYQPEIIEIMLVQTDYFTDMSFMFAGCHNFVGSNELSKLRTEKVTSMANMFLECYMLNSLGDQLKDLGNLNISQVNDISAFFGKCSSLEELPDLSIGIPVMSKICKLYLQNVKI